MWYRGRSSSKTEDKEEQANGGLVNSNSVIRTGWPTGPKASNKPMRESAERVPCFWWHELWMLNLSSNYPRKTKLSSTNEGHQGVAGSAQTVKDPVHEHWLQTARERFVRHFFSFVATKVTWFTGWTCTFCHKRQTARKALCIWSALLLTQPAEVSQRKCLFQKTKRQRTNANEEDTGKKCFLSVVTSLGSIAVQRGCVKLCTKNQDLHAQEKSVKKKMQAFAALKSFWTFHENVIVKDVFLALRPLANRQHLISATDEKEWDGSTHDLECLRERRVQTQSLFLFTEVQNLMDLCWNLHQSMHLPSIVHLEFFSRGSSTSREQPIHLRKNEKNSKVWKTVT